MQPLAGTSAADLLIKTRDGGRIEDALNREEFWRKNRGDVRPDEVFFHDYFEKAGKTSKKNRAEKRASKPEDGDREETDEEEEGQIWKALVGSRPEIEDAEDDIDEDEEDVDITDFMEDDDDDDEEPASDEEGGVAIDGIGGVAFHGFDEDEEIAEAGEEEVTAAAEASDDDGFDVTALEDDDEGALFDSDEELPDSVVIPDAAAAIEEVAKGLKSTDKKKRKKSIKSLPIFATAEDYAKLIGDDDDEDM
jgi:ribosome biogenesis protein MAK21